MDPKLEIARREGLRLERWHARKVMDLAKIKRLPKGILCVRCNERFAEYRHHEDYTKPLETIPLCRSCHRQRHAEIGWGMGWKKPRLKKLGL
jgi:hypothetical protein